MKHEESTGTGATINMEPVWSVGEIDSETGVVTVTHEYKPWLRTADVLGLISRWEERVDISKDQLENRCSGDNHVLHAKLWKEIRIYQGCIKELKNEFNIR